MYTFAIACFRCSKIGMTVIVHPGTDGHLHVELKDADGHSMRGKFTDDPGLAGGHLEGMRRQMLSDHNKEDTLDYPGKSRRRKGS